MTRPNIETTKVPSICAAHETCMQLGRNALSLAGLGLGGLN